VAAAAAPRDQKKRAAVAGGFEVDNREASKQSGQEPLGPKMDTEVIGEKA
jgi:hypothetical protein